MSCIQRIVGADQTVVVIEEDDYIGLLVFIDGNRGGVLTVSRDDDHGVAIRH